MALQQLAEEALCSSSVPAARDQDIQDVAILVYRPPKITTLAADPDEDLVYMPYVTESTLPMTQSTSVRRSELSAPHANGLVGCGDATLGKEILDIAQAQRESMV